MELKKLDEGIYLKKNKGKYSLIYPIKKDLSKPFKKGNIDWKNVWGIRNKQWLTTIFILAIIFFSIWAYKHDIELYRDIAQHPWKYYYFCYEPVHNHNFWQNLNWTLNETIESSNLS